MTWKLLVGGVLMAALASCSSGDLGTGVNTVDREYSASVKEAHDAALMTLKNKDLQIESDKSDSLGASIVAKRGASDDKVLVDVTPREKGKSLVSVRVQPGDKNQATMIQDEIDHNLTKTAK